MNVEEAKAAIGKRVFVSDGTPKPPERFTKKVADWERRNFEGVLVEVNVYGDGCILLKETSMCKFHRSLHVRKINGLAVAAGEAVGAED